jgi:hypothetical protein
MPFEDDFVALPEDLFHHFLGFVPLEDLPTFMCTSSKINNLLETYQDADPYKPNDFWFWLVKPPSVRKERLLALTGLKCVNLDAAVVDTPSDPRTKGLHIYGRGGTVPLAQLSTSLIGPSCASYMHFNIP